MDRTALAAQVYERILQRIVDRQLPPGHHLNIYQLARDLEVSITPVREALARLSSQRLVSFESFKGYSVLPAMDAQRLAQLFEARLVVEDSAVRSGVARYDSRHLTTLLRSAMAMRALVAAAPSREFHAFNDQDQAFHHTLVVASGNVFLDDMYESLSPHIHIGRLYQARGVLAAQQIISEHEAILTAYEQRDGEGAARAVRQHLLAAQRRLDEAALQPAGTEA